MYNDVTENKLLFDLLFFLWAIDNNIYRNLYNKPYIYHYLQSLVIITEIE